MLLSFIWLYNIAYGRFEFKHETQFHVFIHMCLFSTFQLKLENIFSQFGLLYEVVILDAVHQQQEEV